MCSPWSRTRSADVLSIDGPDLLIEGRVLTRDEERPVAEAVLISNARVAAVGSGLACPGEVWTLDGGAVAVPGFVDAHVHLLAMAAALLSVDLSAEVVSSVPGLLGRVREAAEFLPKDAWVRGHGYDDAFLPERRHPTTAELDAAAGGRPAVLHHATGHVVVVSARARSLLGLPAGEEPIPAPQVAGRTPRLERADLMTALASVGEDLARHGVTCVCDATVTNGVDELELLASATLPQRLVVMPGLARLGDFLEAGVHFGSTVHGVRLGHAKVYVSDDTEARDLAAQVDHAHRRDWPVALHVLDVGPLDAALTALGASAPPAGTHDRLEHVALALPEQLDRIAALPVDVVTQPSFVTRRARKYEDELSDVELAWLYPVASLLRRGVRVAFSSDAPVVPARPLESIRAAVARQLAPGERVGPDTALRLATVAAREAAGLGDGRIVPGAPADLVVLSGVPGVSLPEVLATVVGGRVIHLKRTLEG